LKWQRKKKEMLQKPDIWNFERFILNILDGSFDFHAGGF
jgi:hypothetical protein